MSLCAILIPICVRCYQLDISQVKKLESKVLSVNTSPFIKITTGVTIFRRLTPYALRAHFPQNPKGILGYLGGY